MPFRWRQLVGVAARLMSVPSANEAEWRSAVNRSYYAAFGEAQSFATARGYTFMPGYGGSHDQVWRFIRSGRPGDPNHVRAAWRQVADMGLDLKTRRVIADYRGVITVSDVDAATACAIAQTFITRLKGL